MPELLIRSAVADDAAALLSIYRPVVEETAASFELETPSPAEFADRIRRVGESHAWLVAEIDAAVCGYAYGSAHRPRAAYRYSVETSAYVHSDFRGRGVGLRLYASLFDTLRTRGYHHAYAGIALPNEPSIALHKSAGFRAIGTFPSVGFKFGAWHDVSWWHRPLDQPPGH